MFKSLQNTNMCHEISPPQIYTSNYTQTNENASSPTRDAIGYVRLYLNNTILKPLSRWVERKPHMKTISFANWKVKDTISHLLSAKGLVRLWWRNVWCVMGDLLTYPKVWSNRCATFLEHSRTCFRLCWILAVDVYRVGSCMAVTVWLKTENNPQQIV